MGSIITQWSTDEYRFNENYNNTIIYRSVQVLIGTIITQSSPDQYRFNGNYNNNHLQISTGLMGTILPQSSTDQYRFNGNYTNTIVYRSVQFNWIYINRNKCNIQAMLLCTTCYRIKFLILTNRCLWNFKLLRLTYFTFYDSIHHIMNGIYHR